MPDSRFLATKTYRLTMTPAAFVEQLRQQYDVPTWQPFSKRLQFQQVDEDYRFKLWIQRPLASSELHITECHGHVFVDAQGFSRLQISFYQRETVPVGFWQNLLLSMVFVSIFLLIFLPELLMRNPDNQQMWLAASLPVLYFFTASTYQFAVLIAAFNQTDQDEDYLKQEIEKWINLVPDSKLKVVSELS